MFNLTKQIFYKEETLKLILVKRAEEGKFILKTEQEDVLLLYKLNGRMKTLQLPIKFTKQLIKFPETGMGFQLVKVVLKNGLILNDHKVLNSSVLVLNQDEKFTIEEIASIKV